VDENPDRVARYAWTIGGDENVEKTWKTHLVLGKWQRQSHAAQQFAAPVGTKDAFRLIDSSHEHVSHCSSFNYND
jgi:N-acetyl-beta-hexosaminidase